MNRRPVGFADALLFDSHCSCYASLNQIGGPGGLEPPTCGLGNRRSILLSYGADPAANRRQAAALSIHLVGRNDRQRQRRDRHALLDQRLGFAQRSLGREPARGSISPRCIARAVSAKRVADPFAILLSISACSAAKAAIASCGPAPSDRRPAAPSAPSRRRSTAQIGALHQAPPRAARSIVGVGSEPGLEHRRRHRAHCRSNTIIESQPLRDRPAVVERRDPRPHLGDPRQVDLGKTHAGSRRPCRAPPRPTDRPPANGRRSRGRPHAVPTCAAATTNSPASIARARSSTSQCALPVGTVNAAGTAMTSAPASASRANSAGKRRS